MWSSCWQTLGTTLLNWWTRNFWPSPLFLGFFWGEEGVGSNSIANDVSMVITLLIFISPLNKLRYWRPGTLTPWLTAVWSFPSALAAWSRGPAAQQLSGFPSRQQWALWKLHGCFEEVSQEPQLLAIKSELDSSRPCPSHTCFKHRAQGFLPSKTSWATLRFLFSAQGRGRIFPLMAQQKASDWFRPGPSFLWSMPAPPC